MIYSVLLSDLTNFREHEEWAMENCPSFAYRSVIDINDVVHLTMDTVHEFVFGDERDYIWFKLRWC